LGPVELIAVLQISGRAALISVVFVSVLFGMNSVRKILLPIRRAALIWRCDEWFGKFGRTDLALTRVVQKIWARRFGPATSYRILFGRTNLLARTQRPQRRRRTD
jgi:hypothetical protein